MVITRWTNEIQAAIIEEWTEGCQKAKGPQARRVLRKRITEKYALNIHITQGIIELGATQGLNRIVNENAKTDTHKWEPIDYHQLVGGLKERVNVLEKKFEFLLDGIQKVLEDGETMGIHIANLRQMGKWMKKRGALDIQEMASTSLDENESPPPLEIESQNTIGKRKEKRGEIKTKPRATYNDLSPMEKIDRLRTQADNARKRGELLFRGIEKGKKALPRQEKRPTSPQPIPEDRSRRLYHTPVLRGRRSDSSYQSNPRNSNLDHPILHPSHLDLLKSEKIGDIPRKSKIR